MDFVEVISLNYSLRNLYIFISLRKGTGAVLVSFDGDIFAYPEVICIVCNHGIHTVVGRKEDFFWLLQTVFVFFSVKTFHLGLISNEITAGS